MPNLEIQPESQPADRTSVLEKVTHRAVSQGGSRKCRHTACVMAKALPTALLVFDTATDHD